MTPPRLIAHLDFKGLRQHPSLILERLEMLASWGYQGILVEYEDVFPYRENTFSDRKREIWSPAFLEDFLSTARSCGLEVVPLQQTLGHLEYALRWEVFAKFRVPGEHPGTLNVENPAAREWGSGLLREMLAAHPNARYIHLGMDEAAPLVAQARKAGKEPLGVFLDYLEQLCRLCEEAGKIPVIWSDMLDDHLTPAALPRICAFRERVILAPWDYEATSPSTTIARFAGRRVSRHWLDHPEAEGAPKLRSQSQWIEDWPAEVQELAAPYRVGEASLQSLFPAAIWKGLGFRVWGAAAASPSVDGPLLPLFHHRMANLDRWREAVRDWNLDALIVTAWARSQTCSPPGTLPDLQMPLFRHAAQGHCAVGPCGPDEMRDLFLRLGRCRESWGIESDLIAEAQRKLTASDSPPILRDLLIQMLRVQAARRALDLATYQAERYLCGNRLPAGEWDRRLAALKSAADALEALRPPTRALVETRCHGEAVKEWLALVFDDPAESTAALTEKIITKQKIAAARFAALPGVIPA